MKNVCGYSIKTKEYLLCWCIKCDKMIAKGGSSTDPRIRKVRNHCRETHSEYNFNNQS